MGMNKDQLKLIQQFEQAAMAMEPFANFIGVYHKNLVANGFTREESLRLVESFSQMLWAMAFSNHPNQDNDKE